MRALVPFISEKTAQKTKTNEGSRIVFIRGNCAPTCAKRYFLVIRRKLVVSKVDRLVSYPLVLYS